jgi:hypothetical protein
MYFMISFSVDEGGFVEAFGTVGLYKRYIAKLSCPMDFSLFPFDEQTCEFELTISKKPHSNNLLFANNLGNRERGSRGHGLTPAGVQPGRRNIDGHERPEPAQLVRAHGAAAQPDPDRRDGPVDARPWCALPLLALLDVRADADVPAVGHDPGGVHHVGLRARAARARQDGAVHHGIPLDDFAVQRSKV